MPASYSQYLQLEELLNLQRPLTPETEPEVHRSERFFIVVHQASELLAQQALLDLRAVEAELAQQRDRSDGFVVSVERARATLALLRTLMTGLDHLPREHFAAFRNRLDTASACESQQFGELFARMRSVARVDADAVAGLSAELQGWREDHYRIAAWMIGDASGTAGSSGVAYLRQRAEDANFLEEDA